LDTFGKAVALVVFALQKFRQNQDALGKLQQAGVEPNSLAAPSLP